MSGKMSLSCVIVLVLGAGSSAFGQSFDLSWYTVDGGGGTSVGGSFELSGTIGQPDAGVPMTGGNFELTGGFWPGAATTAPCLGDFDGNGQVDLADLAVGLAAFGSCSGDPDFLPDFDFDASGCNDLADLAVLLSAFGTICP